MNLHRLWCCILVLTVLFVYLAPVMAAEPPTLTIVKLYFEKNGSPCQGAFHVNITCYGDICDGRDCRDSAKARMALSGLDVLSENCTGYGCTGYISIPGQYGPYAACDLVASGPGGNFTLRNYSVTPFWNCSRVNPYDFGGYYNRTPEYTRCVEEFRRQHSVCDTFTGACSLQEPGCDILCNGSYGRENWRSRACRNNVSPEGNCGIFRQKINENAMILWKSDSGEEYPADLQCEMHLTLPPDSGSCGSSLPAPDHGMTPSRPDVLPTDRTSDNTAPRSTDPVRSLYCTILRVFGGTC